MKTKIKVHNRFDIELRDAETNELKVKGVAENIVLDRMYTRLCSMNSYFTNIVFGSGTGTLDPTRTTLFNRIDSASASTVETKNRVEPLYVTKRCILSPESYAGQTFTEVGISETTTNINTHALIKDSEGNPLSITKTDLDVLTIYATVYVEISTDNSSFPMNNSVITYLLNGTTSISSGNITVYRHSNSQSKSVSLVADVPNKKTLFPKCVLGLVSLMV